MVCPIHVHEKGSLNSALESVNAKTHLDFSPLGHVHNLKYTIMTSGNLSLQCSSRCYDRPTRFIYSVQNILHFLNCNTHVLPVSLGHPILQWDPPWGYTLDFSPAAEMDIPRGMEGKFVSRVLGWYFRKTFL